MSTIKDLREFVREHPALIGHESEFIYAVYTIDASIGIYSDLGVLGEPFSGKRQFCLALKRWFEERGKKCGILRMDDSSTFSGDIIFLLDSEPVDDDPAWSDRRRQRVASFASENVFVVYTSTAMIFGSGEVISLKELNEDDFFRLVGEVTGHGREIATVSENMHVPIPTSLLIAKSVCNGLMGLRGGTPDDIAKVLDTRSRQRRAKAIIPQTELDSWKARFDDGEKLKSWEALKTWKASRCGMRFFTGDDEGLVGLGIASREGSGFMFSESMRALSYCIWGEPQGSDYHEAIQSTLDTIHSGCDPPQAFYDDAIRLTTTVLDKRMAMDIGLDFTLYYVMELVRHRVYDKNRPLSCKVLLQNADALKKIKEDFENLENSLSKMTCWDSQLAAALKNAVNNNTQYDIDKIGLDKIKRFIAREIKSTVSSETLTRLNIPGANLEADEQLVKVYEHVCDVIETFNAANSTEDWTCSRYGLSDSEKNYSKFLHAIRKSIDTRLLEIQERYVEEKDCSTNTVMGFQKTIEAINELEEDSRQSPWVHLLWDEFEVNARWVNLKTVYGYAESSTLIRCIDYIHEVNTTYPLSRFKPVNEEIDFSSISMYSELLDPEMFILDEKFVQASWYEEKNNYGLDELDRSVIYLKKSRCRISWERRMEWNGVYEQWEEIYDAAEKATDRNDKLMRMNLLRDLFHYFRMYCECDSKGMSSKLGELEKIHRKMDSEPLKVIYALSTLELSRAELLCGHKVKSMEYLDIVRTMEANSEVDNKSALYRVALMDTEASLEFELGRTRSAIRRMEDMRSECMTNGLVSQYVVAGKHLYEMYGQYGDSGNINRRISRERLKGELKCYADKLKDQEVGKKYQLVLDIIEPVINSDPGTDDSKLNYSNGSEGADNSKPPNDEGGNIDPVSKVQKS